MTTDSQGVFPKNDEDVLRLIWAQIAFDDGRRLSGTEVYVLLLLWNEAGKGNAPLRITKREMCKRIGGCDEKTLTKAVQGLLDLGLIKREQEEGGRIYVYRIERPPTPKPKRIEPPRRTRRIKIAGPKRRSGGSGS